MIQTSEMDQQMVDLRSQRTIDEKVRDVVLFFTYTSAYRLHATQIMKLAYLSELRSLERRGKRLTRADFVHWRYGPFSQSVARAMDGIPELKAETRGTSRGRMARFYLLQQPRVKVRLTQGEIQLLSDVGKDWLSKDSDDLVSATKMSPPFTWTKFGDEIPFDRYAEFVKKMSAAKVTDDKGDTELANEEDIITFVKRLRG